MYCERCNADFPDGLRYCKWCGGALVDQPRVTGELHTCPSCSAAIQPGWAFCKSCGERLNAPARQPTTTGAITPPNRESASTAVIATCSACGERMDTGSLYCKACGSAAYAQPQPLGASTLLCGKCKNYSPVGSLVCRMCGAPFVEAPKTVIERAVSPPTVQDKPKTLPDLDDHLAARESRPPSAPVTDSGSNTMIFTGAERENIAATPRGTGSVETNFLPGTAGARSEQQNPTSVMHMGRITGPVEDETPRVASGELPHTPEGGERTAIVAAEPVAASAEPAETTPAHSTLGLGAEATDSALDSENKTQVFVSPSLADSTLQHLSQEEARTRAFEPLEQQATRAFEPPPMTGTASEVTSEPQWTSPAQIEPSAPGDISTPVVPVLKKKTGNVVSVIVALVVIVAAGFAAWWFLFARTKPTPPAPPVVVEQPPVVPPAVPEKPPAPLVPEGMVAVAAGTYTIGRDDGDPLEQPQHKVDVTAFYIDRTEVTNAAYKKFMDATNRNAPTNWPGTSYPEGRDDSPVTGVTWQDAADYAVWAGKRLPSEAEWEAAARGADGRIYPWGNDFRASAANIGLKADKPSASQYPSALKAAGRYPQGASPAGALDMIGNAWEWVADEIKVYPGNTESKLELDAGAGYRVIRGGAYDGKEVHDATYRGYLDSSQPYPKVGFRCAKDAK